MQPPGHALINEFADAFAQKGNGRGMTREEIVAFFRRYSNNVTDPEFFGLSGVTKKQIFQYCLDRLPVEEQYRALLDLCKQTPSARNQKTMPSEERREELLQSLHTVGSSTGLTVRAVGGITSWEIRQEWIKTLSRLEKSPAAAITSARTLLERVCKSVLHADGETGAILTDGDLGKLVRATRDRLGLDDGERMITQGVSTLVNGVARLSNTAGDRHGSVVGPSSSLVTARLACDTAFALALYLLDHAETSR